MNSFEKNISFIIVCFNSGDVIEDCIKSISPNNKIVIVDNLGSIQTKKYLENKFLNVEVIISKENLGYGKGNNLGISKIKTRYAFILNPDTILEKNCLSELSRAQSILKNNFTILAPNFSNNYGYFFKKNVNTEAEILDVDYIKGFAFLIDLEKINSKKIFDENFFLFLEEIDLCKKIKDNGGKIYVVKNSKIFHYGKKASGDSLNIELCRQWHWMWSFFYYNKKHFGYFQSLIKILPKLVYSTLKFILYIFLLNKKKYLIYFFRIFGILNAILNKSSWYRPKID